jgi:TRAP transporter T-component
VAALNHDDPDTIAAALPSYLLLLDAGAAKPDASGASLCAAAKLYGAYSGGFVSDVVRQQRLSARTLRYGDAGACKLDEQFCKLRALDFDGISSRAATFDADDLPALSCLASAWAADVQARADQPEAQADVPKVRVLYERIAVLAPAFNQGEAQIVLGVLNSLLPPAFGGKPELGKAYFERAIEQSSGKNLMAKVLYAQYFARLTFEQALHDRLLNEVLQASSDAPDLTLQNQIAKTRAAALLASGKDYF